MTDLTACGGIQVHYLTFVLYLVCTIKPTLYHWRGESLLEDAVQVLHLRPVLQQTPVQVVGQHLVELRCPFDVAEHVMEQLALFDVGRRGRQERSLGGVLSRQEREGRLFALLVDELFRLVALSEIHLAVEGTETYGLFHIVGTHAVDLRVALGCRGRLPVAAHRGTQTPGEDGFLLRAPRARGLGVNLFCQPFAQRSLGRLLQQVSIVEGRGRRSPPDI